MTAPDDAVINLAVKITTENKDIPIIETDEQERIHAGNCEPPIPQNCRRQ